MNLGSDAVVSGFGVGNTFLGVSAINDTHVIVTVTCTRVAKATIFKVIEW